MDGHESLLNDVTTVAQWDRVCILVEDIGVESGQWEAYGAGLLGCHGQRGDDVASGLGLPPGINDGCLVSADVLPVPHIGLGVQGLAHRCQNSDCSEVVLLHKGFAGLHEHSDSGWCSVQDRYAVLLNYGPPATQIWEVGRSLVQDAGSAKAQRAIYYVAVAGDPAAVCGAPEDIIVVNIQYPGRCLSGSDSISAVSMLNTLGLAGCAGCVQNKQPVLWIERDGLALSGLAGYEIIVEDIASLCHGYGNAGPLDDDYLLDGGCVLHGLIYIGFEGQGLSAPVESVCCDDNFGLGIVDPACQST